MRSNQILILIMILSLSYNVSGKQKQTIIKGTTVFKGTNEITFAGFIENPIYDIGKEYTVLPDSNNCFHLNLDIMQFSEVWVQTGMGTKNALSKQIFLSPGDELNVEINESGISFKGKGSEKNNLYNIIEDNGLQTFQLTRPLMNNQISMEEYIDNIKDFKEKRNQLLGTYQKENSLEKEFIDFYNKQTEIEYRNLIVAAFKHSFYTANSVNLFDYFKNEISVANYTNDQWVNLPSYVRNLRNYLFYIKGREISKSSKNISYFGGISIALTDSLNGKTQEFAMAEYICSDLEDGKYDSLEINYFKKNASNSLAKTTVKNAIEKFEQKEYLIGKPIHEEFAQTLIADTANNQLDFGSMLNSYKGNIVYMEIWSLGCGPCRKAMPTSREIEKELAPLPVKFVYLTTDKLNDNLWNDVFRASLTKENHYRLINGSHSRLNTFMNTTLVPWYMLFDKEGNLLEFHAKEPNSIKETLVELAK